MKKVIRFATAAIHTLNTEWVNADPMNLANMSCQVIQKKKKNNAYVNPWRF